MFIKSLEVSDEDQRAIRLIEAAPEFYAACKQFLTSWEQWDDGPSCAPVYESLALIRGIIARVEATTVVSGLSRFG